MNNETKTNTANILVVDDTPVNLKLLSELLSKQGYDVRPVADPQLALSGAKSLLPDLILLDIKMPGMDGYEFCGHLKAAEKTKDIPVIFISALEDSESITKGFAVGGVDYITKPFQQQEVLVRVRFQLELRNAIRTREMAIHEKEQANLLMETIFSSVQDTIITIDENLKIIHCNKIEEEICCLPNMEGVSFFQKQQELGIGPCHDLVVKTLKTQQPVKEHRIECSCHRHGNQTLVLNASPLKSPTSHLSGVVLVIRNVSRLAKLEKELLERGRFGNIIGKSKKIQKIFALLEQMANIEFNALIIGESGTGKELIADAIHYGGIRADKPLVKVNCAALSDNLLESELFGHVRGAFTGAVSDREGRIEAAESGTIFLDEIGDISMAMQLRLLRFLESKDYERVGESKTKQADVRVVAATNSNLLEKVRQGTFREDLYYRLMGVVFELPPLRERMEDLLLIGDYFIQKFAKNHQKHIIGVSEPVKKIFLSHSWPGNIREFRNIIEFACALCTDGLILEEHLPPYFLNTLNDHSTDRKMAGSLEKPEKEAIVQALDQVKWNKAKAARVLGISRATIYNKIKEYGIE